MNKLEECARAMYRDTTDDPHWPPSDAGQADIYRSNARAVIACLSEPSEEMLATVEPALDDLYNGVKEDPGYEAGGKAVWQAMLKAVK